MTVGTNTAAGAITSVITINDGATLAAGANNLALANGVQTTGAGLVDTKAFNFHPQWRHWRRGFDSIRSAAAI